MAGKNEVTLTFAGDTSKLEKAFSDVDASAKRMSDGVDRSAERMEASFDGAGASIDGVGDKGGDLESGLRGTTDVMTGFSAAMKGDVMGGLTDMAGGVEALAMGFSGVLVPALQKAWGWLGQTKVGMLAHAAATKLVSAATKVWTAVQAAFNFVLAMNPIVLVVVAIVALVAVIIIAYKKSETFRNIVNAAFRSVLRVVRSVWNWIRSAWNRVYGWLRQPIVNAISAIRSGFRGFRSAISSVWNFIRNGFRRVTNWITAPFNAGFRAVRSLWNRWLGGKGFNISIPRWVPVIGGNSYGFRIPSFHQGGIMPGAPGTEGLALLQAGERVLPRNRSAAHVTVTVDTRGAYDEMLRLMRKMVRVEGGGNVQKAFGVGA